MFLIYIREAHAEKPSMFGEDNWQFHSRYAQGERAIIHKNHSTTTERIDALQKFKLLYPELEKSNVTFLIEPIRGDTEDVFSRVFHPWPTRFIYCKQEMKKLVLHYISYFEKGGYLDFNTFSSTVLQE